MDHQAWLEREDGEEAQAAYKYFMRPDPSQREFLSDAYELDDPLTGKVARVRDARVGMVRNAQEKDRREVRVYLGFDGQPTLPHIRIDDAKPLQGWYQAKTDPNERKRPRPCFTDAILTEPYGGYCTVGCAFCYVNSGFRGYRGSGLISVPIRYGDQVRKMLSRMKTSAAGYFSSFTDPFLPLEGYYHNTEEGARAFVEQGLPIFFLSRLPYPGWAIDMLELNPHSYAQKSINTPDPATWRKLSPGALPLEDHLEEIRELSSRGIYVSIQCNPIVPGVVTHADVELLFERLAEAGANHVIVKFVEAGYSWAPAMVQRIERRFPGARSERFKELFVDNIGGQRTIDEAYRLAGHQLYRAKASSLGMTYASCYEYKYERDAAGKILSKRGISIGREVTTADQCHGQRVPLYTRATTDAEFRAVEHCPPSGCLYCADENEGKPRCGDERFGAAKALRTADFLHQVGGPPKGDAK